MLNGSRVEILYAPPAEKLARFVNAGRMDRMASFSYLYGLGARVYGIVDFLLLAWGSERGRDSSSPLRKRIYAIGKFVYERRMESVPF